MKEVCCTHVVVIASRTAGHERRVKKMAAATMKKREERKKSQDIYIKISTHQTNTYIHKYTNIILAYIIHTYKHSPFCTLCFESWSMRNSAAVPKTSYGCPATWCSHASCAMVRDDEG